MYDKVESTIVQFFSESFMVPCNAEALGKDSNFQTGFDLVMSLLLNSIESYN